MAPSQPTTTTQIQKVELPEWVDKASESNYKFAQEIANKPLEQYQGRTVADLGRGTTDAWNMFYNTLGTGQNQFGSASNIFQGVAGAETPTVDPALLADMDLSKYMNPYTQNVVDTSMANLERSRQLATGANADAATAARAFGGSRHGIVDAVTNAETARNAGSLSAQLYSDAFNKATELATGDLGRTQAAQMANQAATLQKLGLNTSAAQGLLTTGTAMNQQRMQDISGLSSIGTQQQMQDQRVIDADVAKFNEARGYDTERLNLLLSSLGMSPYGKTETTKKETSGGGGGFDFMTGGLGLMSLLFGLSDRDQKTDIRKVSVHEETGIPIYSYRYKGDPKNYPKIVGPMAQDVEKVMPSAVINVGGTKMVRKDVLGILSGVG